MIVLIEYIIFVMLFYCMFWGVIRRFVNKEIMYILIIFVMMSKIIVVIFVIYNCECEDVCRNSCFKVLY